MNESCSHNVRLKVRERERARNQCHQQVNKVSTAQIILLNVSPIHSVNRDSENNQSVENVMAKIIFTILKYAQYEYRKTGSGFHSNTLCKQPTKNAERNEMSPMRN